MSRKFQDRQELTLPLPPSPTVSVTDFRVAHGYLGLVCGSCRLETGALGSVSRCGRERAWSAGRAGSRRFSSSLTGTGLVSFEAEDLAALTESLIGRATLTDDGFLYASFRQVEAPGTWTADAAYPADSPIPDTFTAKAETLLGRPAPRRPPGEKCTLVVCELVLRKPDLASPASQAPTPPRSLCRRLTARSCGFMRA